MCVCVCLWIWQLQVFGRMSVGQPSHAVFAHWFIMVCFLMVCLLLVSSCAEKWKCSMHVVVECCRYDKHLRCIQTLRSTGANSFSRWLVVWNGGALPSLRVFTETRSKVSGVQIWCLEPPEAVKGYFNRAELRKYQLNIKCLNHLKSIAADAYWRFFEKMKLRKSRKCRAGTSSNNSNILQYHQYQILSAWCSLVQAPV